jgi:hypothetical protein
VYVEVTPDGFAALAGEQALAPPVPEMAQVTFPIGATALAFPVTVAVKVRVAFKVEPPAEVTAIVGVAAATVVFVADAAADTGRYPLSPGKVKLAP